MTVEIGDIVACLALILSVYATWTTARFNKRQESLLAGQEKLNAVLLQKELADTALAARADLGASFIKLGNGNYRLKLFNKGRAAALQVQVEFPEGNALIPESEITDRFPLEALDTYQSVELVAAVTMGAPRKMAVKLMWTDSDGMNNEKTVYATL